MIGTINQTMWEDLPRGNISIRFYANDTRENVAYVEVIVFKDFPPKSVPAIPGYSLILVIGVITIISVVSIKRQRRI